ncbi:MAG: type 2 isopentenyl-diphosphate Delta-isomerase [Hyphomicrobiaceae bacterium]
MSEIRSRKDAHLDIVLSGEAAATGASHFDRIRFVHEAAPSFALADIDLSVLFLGHRLRAPLLISAMTGGPARAGRINEHLAEAAEALGLAMAVGSQRIAIEAEGDAGVTRSLRQIAPSAMLIANIGAAQVAAWKSPAKVLHAVDMIEADALYVHFNPLQEALQPSGDTDWRGLDAALEDLCRASPVPVLAKEVGAGISARTARRLVDLGVQAIDVAGTGGTSWAAVETERHADAIMRETGVPFRDWGIPTPVAISQVAGACPGVPIVASGGIRHGLDAARAIRLGADVVGQAARLLAPAIEGSGAVVAALEGTLDQLRIACFCTGSQSLDDLRRAPLQDFATAGSNEFNDLR